MSDTDWKTSTSPPVIQTGSDLLIPEGSFNPIDRELRINEALPGLNKHEPTALLLDLNNLFLRTRENGFSIDFHKLYHIFSSRCDLRIAQGFTAVDLRDRDALEWVAWMRKRNYVMETKPLARFTNSEGDVTTKGNMDIEICLAARDLSEGIGHVILATCDGDFVPLVERLRRGSYRKVSVLGVTNRNMTGMSRALKDSADNFYDMSDIRDLIAHKEFR